MLLSYKSFRETVKFIPLPAAYIKSRLMSSDTTLIYENRQKALLQFARVQRGLADKR